MLGEPAPQGSKRHVGSGRMVEVSKKVKPWRQAVSKAAHSRYKTPIEGAVSVSLVFVFQRPKHHHRANGELKEGAPRWKTTMPDADKLARSTLDGLTGKAFCDDSQVVRLEASKRFAMAGEPSGAIVTVVELTCPP